MPAMDNAVAMRTIRRDAVQVHLVPAHVTAPRDIFPQPRVEILEQEYDPDAWPAGATAQNGMVGVTYYECRDCQAVLREDELDTHSCEETSP